MDVITYPAVIKVKGPRMAEVVEILPPGRLI